MSMPPLLLEHFTQPTPICLQTDSIAELWHRFRPLESGFTESDLVVVVNECHSPVGVVYLRGLIATLLNENRQPQTLPPPEPDPTEPSAGTPLRSPQETTGKTDDSWPSIAPELWQQPLNSFTPGAIAPIEIIPTDGSSARLWQTLQQQRSHPHPCELALVDSTGKFLGLLDYRRLLEALAHRSGLSYPQPDPPSEEENAPDLYSQLTPKSLPLAALRPLAELLEEIPLPMKLQTATGKVLSHNQAWRSQFGEILQEDEDEIGDPEVQQEKTQPDATHPSQPSAAALQISLGSCPMPSRNDRAWQFVKIPIGLTLSERAFPLPFSHSPQGFHPTEANRSAPEERSLSSTPFISDSTSTEATSQPLWLVLAQDVTVQQQVAKELAAKNADLMQLNRLKDEFLACISHELKTPLTAVLGLSSLLKERTLGPLSDRQARYAHMIYNSGRHLMNVVNDILDLTRIESGQMELILEPVSIPEVCDRAFDQAKQSHHPSDSTHPTTEPDPSFTLEIEPGLTNPIADELRLRQMLYNLLSNALKFTPPGGKFGLKVTRWEGWIAFTVWDTGIGIPAQKQHLIFQKFQQLENPMTRQFEGTGLGLVLTQRLARAHGGDVTFISKEGMGSEFTLLLPPSPPQPTTALGEPVAPANRLVLIVEAVPRYIEELSEQLSAFGYRVAIARAGTEAVEKARRLQPRAIFLNSLLPMLSGWDVLTLLKSDPQTQHIPSILMATEVDKERAHLAGADGFLTLPVQRNSLQKILDAVTSSASPSDDDLDRSPPTKLTLLRLSPVEAQHLPETRSHSADTNPLSAELNALLTWGLNPNLGHHYRVLEADDLDQAELLARVWHFDAILLDTSDRRLDDPLAFVERFSQFPVLASVPLVTFDRQTTEAALHFPGLTVFPCLKPAATSTSTPETSWPDTAALLHTIEVAAGISSKPTILVVDISTLPEFARISASSLAPASELDNSQKFSSNSGKNEWLQATLQYIQTAGFRSLMGRSWPEVWHQLQHHSVDLLLICLTHSVPFRLAIELFKGLEKLPDKPAILILDRSGTLVAESSSLPVSESRVYDEQNSPLTSTRERKKISEMRSLLKAIATQVLPSSISMEDLLDRINTTLKGTGNRE